MRKFTLIFTVCVLLEILMAGLVSAADFTDVPLDYWAREDIQYVTDRGVFLGKTPDIFDPSGGMTRGQMAMVLYRLAGLPEIKSDMHYLDVPEDMYCYNAVLWSHENGIFTIEKQRSDHLNPDEAVTRGEFAVMLRNYDFTLNNREEFSAEIPLETKFTDMDNVSMEIRNAILGWAYPRGILRGTGETTMNPSGRLTRAHVAAMLARYDQTAENYSGYPFHLAGTDNPQNFYGKTLMENTVYTMLVGEEYSEDNYTVTSENPEIAEIIYQNHAWQIHTKSAGKTAVTITDKRTGAHWTLNITVGENAENGKIPPETGINPEAFMKQRIEIVCLVNEARKRSGTKEITVSETLMDAAQMFAETQPKDHDLTLETECRERFGCYHGVGCNIFISKGYALSEIPELAVSGWEKSRGHYITMTNEAADSVGIGLYFDGSQKQCYCVMFIGDCLLEGELFGNYHM